MTLYILDTDHTSLLQRGNKLIAEGIAPLSYEEIAVTTITAEEQLRGRLKVIRRASTEDPLIRAYSALHTTLDFFKQIKLVDLDRESLGHYKSLREKKIRIGTQDLRIASVALAKEAILLTCNTKDFIQVPGLIIEDWSRTAGGPDQESP